MANITTLPTKAGVISSGITQELDQALGVAQGVYASFGQPFTITSITDGTHVANSKHYIGQAADLRTNGVDPTTVPRIASTLQSQLGSQYLVILEGDHIHVQYNGVGTALDSYSYGSPASPTSPDLSADSGGFDLSAIFGGDTGAPTPLTDAGVLSIGTLSTGAIVGLVIAGLALYFYFRD